MSFFSQESRNIIKQIDNHEEFEFKSQQKKCRKLLNFMFEVIPEFSKSTIFYKYLLQILDDFIFINKDIVSKTVIIEAQDNLRKSRSKFCEQYQIKSKYENELRSIIELLINAKMHNNYEHENFKNIIIDAENKLQLIINNLNLKK